MTLQRRLALTIAISAVPLVLGVAWVRTEMQRRVDVQMLRDLVLTRASGVGRERCEAEPEHFLEGPPPREARLRPGPVPGRPGEGDRPRPFPPPRLIPRSGGVRAFGFRPLQAFVYDETFQSEWPFAPAFPPDLQQALASGREVASRRVTLQPPAGDRTRGPAGPDPRGQDPPEMLEVAVRTGWSGGPCAVVLARRIGPSPSASSWDLVASAIPVLAGLIGVVWIASGPLVRRVRALTAAVRRSADARYEVTVPEKGRDEIAELARAFNEAGAAVRGHLATVEQRERTLREFLANTTHDVMIPLTVLQGHLSALQKDSGSGRAVDASVLIAALQEAQYMSSLLHNLGAAAKLEAPDQLLQRHPVDLNALVDRVAERHRPVARAAGVELEFAVPERAISIEGDVTLLEQAVSNAVHNAVRYNRRGGHVAIVLDPLPGFDNAFSLRVVDDGPGVPEEKLSRLTERRYRDEAARQRDPHGLGLGLAIAREVAERHGLQLRIGRSEQGGLQVEFRTVAS